MKLYDHPESNLRLHHDNMSTEGIHFSLKDTNSIRIVKEEISSLEIQLASALVALEESRLLVRRLTKTLEEQK